MPASRIGAHTLPDWPHNPVRLVCLKCGRAGRYRRQTLLARFGPDASMPDVLAEIAACDRQGRFSDPCQVIYADH